MNDRDFDDLLDAYFSGAASPRELAELEGILRDDPNRRLALATRSLLEVHLHKAFSGLAPTSVPAAPAKAPAVHPTSRHWLRIAQGAAAAVLLVAAGWLSAFLLRGTSDRNAPIAVGPKHDVGVPEQKTVSDAKPQPPAHAIKKAMASLDIPKTAGPAVGRIDGARIAQVEPKKDVAAAKETRPNAAAIEPPDDGKQGILVPEPKGPKGKGPAATGPRSVRGTLRAYDAESATLTVRTKLKGRDGDHTYQIAQECAVFVAGKAAGFDDLRVGTDVWLHLAEDRRTVIEIRDGKD